MRFHGKPLTHGHYSLVVIIIRKGLVKLSFLNEDVTRMKDVANGINPMMQRRLICIVQVAYASSARLYGTWKCF
jgi:hypothetical protein